MFRKPNDQNWRLRNDRFNSFTSEPMADRIADLRNNLIGSRLSAWELSWIAAIFFSYLFGCLFWLGLSLGCFLVSMIHQLTGGRWGYPTRRFLEAGFMVLPWMLLLFVPVFLGLHNLYPWAVPSEVGASRAARSARIPKL